MPKRPRAHTIEDESRRTFAAILPTQWVIRPKSLDYGIDDEVELFDQHNSASGLLFLVQVKATDLPMVQDKSNVYLKLDTLQYFRSLLLRVMIVFYHSPTKKIYWRWADDSFSQLDDLIKSGVMGTTFSIPLSAEWTSETARKVESELRMYQRDRSPEIGRHFFELTITDHQTGLYNTRHLDSMLDTEIYRSRRYNLRFSMIRLEVQGLKALRAERDKHDKLLREIGEEIKTCCRMIDLVYRYGDEEFCVLMPQTPRETACQTAGSVSKSLHEGGWLETPGLQLILIARVVTFPEDASNGVELLDGLERAVPLPLPL